MLPPLFERVQDVGPALRPERHDSNDEYDKEYHDCHFHNPNCGESLVMNQLATIPAMISIPRIIQLNILVSIGDPDVWSLVGT